MKKTLLWKGGKEELEGMLFDETVEATRLFVKLGDEENLSPMESLEACCALLDLMKCPGKIRSHLLAEDTGDLLIALKEAHWPTEEGESGNPEGDE